MTDHIETADILDGAADYIEKNGWYQGDFYADERGENGSAACALGALLAVDDRQDHYPLARMALEDVLPQGNPDVAVVPAWNDAPERTKQEVLDALRLAAKNERIAADFGGDAA